MPLESVKKVPAFASADCSRITTIAFGRPGTFPDACDRFVALVLAAAVAVA